MNLNTCYMIIDVLYVKVYTCCIIINLSCTEISFFALLSSLIFGVSTGQPNKFEMYQPNKFVLHQDLPAVPLFLFSHTV